jgi:hypothetical protein
LLHTWRQCNHDADRQPQITFNEYPHTFRNAEPLPYSETHGIQSAIVTPIPNSAQGGEWWLRTWRQRGDDDRSRVRASGEWIYKEVKLFGASGIHQAYGEFCRKSQIICQMPTAEARLHPDLQVSVLQLDERSADQPSGSSAFQTTREIMAEIAEEWDQISTPEPDEQPFDGMSRI